MKRIIPIAITAMILLASCHRPYDAVFSTYKDGQPKLVFICIDGKGGQVNRVGEKMYYENGQLMYVKHYDNDKPVGEWEFYHENGKTHAKGSFDIDDKTSKNWKLYNEKGEEYITDYDSMKVIEFTADNRPLSIAYFKDSVETRFRFNENYTINFKGNVINNLKEGRWEFFYANGQKMLEANYLNGVENGAYNSYRENGIPYFLGFYINGKRANVWEFYDEQGNLAGKQDYDTH